MDSLPRICLISDDDAADSPDLRLGELLASAGWDVHILACAPGVRLATSTAHVTVSHLADVPETAEAAIAEWAFESDRRSLHVLAVLEQLHATRPFDVIQYPEEGAVGFRVAQAKQTGSVLGSAYLLAELRGPSVWRRTEEARWTHGPQELIQHFGEQTSFELADGRASVSRYLIDEARRLGWAVPESTTVVPDCPNPTGPVAPLAGPVGEVVFAGKLDKLHGLRVFVRAVQSLPVEVPVAFVGPDGMVDDERASRWAAGKLKGRRVTFHQTSDRPSIVEFLRRRNRLAVLPYLSAVDIEFARTLARNGVPFLVSDFGPAAELIADADVRRHVVFPASASGLAGALAAYFAEPGDLRRGWVERLAVQHASEADRAAICKFYERILAEVRARRVTAVAVPAVPLVFPKVTVGITHFNLGRFLPATLASVASQTYPNLEVVVADDGSTDRYSLAVLAEMEHKYPQFRFIHGTNLGVCGNRNRCLDAATGEFFFPLDADNVAAPEMIERLVTALERQSEGVAAVSCFWLGFTGDENLAAKKFCGVYRPTGGPRVAVGLWNPYGETSGLFRTSVLRELGGYDDLHPEYMSEDWHLYIKIAARGLNVAVIPRALYFYRIRNDSRYRTGDHAVNHLRVLPDVGAIKFTQPELLEVWTLLAGMLHAANQRPTDQQFKPLLARLIARLDRIADNVPTFLRGALSGGRSILKVLQTLARPRRLVGRLRAVKQAISLQLQQILEIQLELKAEVRELEQSGLLAAIHVIEDHQRSRLELAKDCAQLQRRLDALDLQLGRLSNEDVLRLRSAELDHAA